MKTSRLSYGFLLSFLLTVFVLQWWQLSSYPIGILSALILIAFVSGISARMKRVQVPAALTAASSIGILIAIFTVARTTHVTTNHDIEYFADGKTHEVHGTIIDAPDVRPTMTKYTVLADHVTASGQTLLVTGKILVNDAGGWPEHIYGERVTVTGKLERPAPIETFAYDQYLSIRNIYAIMPRARLQTAPDNEARTPTINERVIGSLYRIRKSFEGQINKIFPEPHASLLAGLLTGSRRGIPEYMSNDFRAAGVTHIVAISGYNVTIILALFSGFLFWLPLKKRFPVLVAAIVLFTIFVGASASVVRSAIMGILGLLALQAGRQTTVWLLILWTAFVMIAWNPAYLWYDAGFQLSFLAVTGLAAFSDPLKKLLKHVPETLAIRDSLTATLAAQIATLPLTIILFKQISLVAPLTNILVAPLIPLAMLVGFIATILGFLWLPLGLLIGYVAWAILQMIIWIAAVCAHLPGAVIGW